MPVLAIKTKSKRFDRRTLTGTTANVYANKPWEDLDYSMECARELAETYFDSGCTREEIPVEVTAMFDELEDRIERHDAVLQRKDYDIWISKFRKLKQACGRLFSKLKQFMWDDMDRIDRGFVYVMLIYAVVCFVIFY
jgi:hypothetical protein|tara:strand:+ start:654 stop:1067 length:414 start_codon:yes stop_codon:yes gene_type:complete